MGHDLQFDPRFGAYTGLDEPADNAVKVYPNPGETLADLAKTLGVDPDRLALANPQIKSPNQPLLPSQEITVPKDLNPQIRYAGLTQPDKADAKPPSSPRAGEVQDIAKQMAQLEMNERTALQFAPQAMKAGLTPVEAAQLTTRLKSLPPAEFNREAALVRDALNSKNPDRALRTYLDIAPMRQAHPDRITAGIERTLVMGVATSRTNTDLGKEGVLGRNSAHHAAETLVKMPESEYKQVSGALAQAGRGGGPNGSAETERALILKAVGARQESMTSPNWVDQARLGGGMHMLATDEITKYAAAIRGQNRADLIDKSTVMDLTHGAGGLQQRFTCTCGPTTAQITEAEADPIAAWRMHGQTIHSTSSAGDVAEEQRATLASSGDLPVPRNFPALGAFSEQRGMSLTPALNQIASGPTHRHYSDQDVDDSREDRTHAMDEMAGLLRQGVDVPIRVKWDPQDDPKAGAHFELATDVRGFGPNREFLITEPWNGTSAWVKEGDIAKGHTNFLAGTGRLADIYPGTER